jgi:hypothetical protein
MKLRSIPDYEINEWLIYTEHGLLGYYEKGSGEVQIHDVEALPDELSRDDLLSLINLTKRLDESDEIK